MKPRRLQLDMEVKTCSMCPLQAGEESIYCLHLEVKDNRIDDSTCWEAEGKWNNEIKSYEGQYFPEFCPLKEITQ